VQVREAVAEAGPEVQQGAGGFVRHAVVTVGGAGHHTFEKTEYTAHAFDFVQCSDEMHLGRSGIGKADVHAVHHQRAYEAFSAVHFSPPSSPTLCSVRCSVLSIK
jgi:hypothetical protein